MRRERNYAMKTRITTIILMAGIMALIFLSCQSPLEPIPSVPSKVSAVPLSQSSIKILWASSPDAKNYEIYRDAAKVADAKDPLFIDDGLECGTTYVYAVRSVNGAGKSEMSETVYTETDQCTPGAPSEVTGIPEGKGIVRISWKLNPPFTETGIRPIWKQRDTIPQGIDWDGPQYPHGSTSGLVSYLPPGRKGYPTAVAIVITHGRWYFSEETTGKDLVLSGN